MEERTLMEVGVLGAGGFLGGLVAEELERIGVTALPLGGAELATDERSLRAELDRCALAISTLGQRDLTRLVLEAALVTGTDLVDAVGDPGTLRWATDECDDAARDRGVTVVLAAGFSAVPGDALANLAAHAVTAPRELHICYAFPSSGGILGALSGGTRRAFADLLGEPALALSGGELVEELLGEVRRLAWFPRPVGPAHAAGVVAPEPLTVPRHVPSVRTVRSYLAVSSWRAELLQAVGTMTRRPRGRRLVAKRLAAHHGGPSRAQRMASRWACVAEAQGDDESVARAWAYGTDPYGTSAASLVTLASAVLAGHADVGIVPPAMAEVPSDLLDTLSARTDLRWSISRPKG